MSLSESEQLQLKNLYTAFLDSNKHHARPCVRFTFREPLPADDRLASKLGGQPFWPENVSYEKKMGNPKLALLAQFNLGKDLDKETCRALDYPDDGGILQLFVEDSSAYGLFAEGHDGFKIIYWPRDVVRDFSAALGKVPAVPEKNNEQFPMRRGRPLKIHFEQLIQAEPIGRQDFRFADPFLDFVRNSAPELLEKVEAGSEEKWKKYELLDYLESEGDHGAGSKLRGNPTFTQEDPRIGRVSKDSELLLQLDSDMSSPDHKNHVLFGDCGVMNFFIAKSYGQQKSTFDFEDAAITYNWDCS